MLFRRGREVAAAYFNRLWLSAANTANGKLPADCCAFFAGTFLCCKIVPTYGKAAFGYVPIHSDTSVGTAASSLMLQRLPLL